MYQHGQPRIYPKVNQISFVLEVEGRPENGIRGRLNVKVSRYSKFKTRNGSTVLHVATFTVALTLTDDNFAHAWFKF